MVSLYNVWPGNVPSVFLTAPEPAWCISLTVAVVYSCDFETVLTACLDDGFHWLTNQIVEYFKPHATNGMTPV